MIRRLADLLKGLLALAAIAALLVGVPLALVVFVGEPVTDLRQAVTGQLLSDNSRATLALRGGLTVVVWLAWLQLALALVIETAAVARGRIASRAPVLPGIQTLARKLVVTATLLANVFAASPSTVSALLPLAVPPPAEHLELAVLSPAEGPGPELRFSREVGSGGFLVGDQEAPAGQGPRYTAGAGDTFWSVAESTLGDGLRWSEVREANLGRTMADGTIITTATEVVKAGWDLILPAGAVVPTPAAPLSTPLSTVVESVTAAAGPDATGATLPDPSRVLATWDVEEGDNFWVIAEETLTARYGRPVTDDEVRPYWLELVEANRNRLLTGDADLIYPGQSFDVPTPPAATASPIPADAPGGADTVLDQVGRLGAGGPGDSSGVGGAGATPDGMANSMADGAGAIGGGNGGPEGTDEDGDRWTVVEPPQDPRGLSPLEPGAGEAVPVGAERAALGLLGTAVGAAAFLGVLRRRRQLQAVRRQPGTTTAGLPASAARYESRIRSVADAEAAGWLEAANRYLSASLARQPQPVLPSVVAMRAGEFGVEVLLDEVCPPPEGFVDSGGGGASWRLHPDLSLDRMEAQARDARPYSPALVPLGRTDAGDLLVDLEQLAVLSVAGDPGTVGAWMTTLATALTAMSWSQEVAVVAIGVPAVPAPAVTVPTDVAAWADRAEADLRAAADRQASTTYHRRVFGGQDHQPTIVLLGPGHEALAHRLAATAELVHAPLVLITTTAVDGAARVELEPDRGVLLPDASGLRLEFTPVLTDAAAAARAAWLLRHAADPSADGAGLFDEVPDTVRRRPAGTGPGPDRSEADQAWPPPAQPRTERPELALPDRPVDPPTPSDLPDLPDLRTPPTPPGEPILDEPVTARGDERERLLQTRPVETRVLTDRPRVLGLDGVAGTPLEAAIVQLGALRQVPLSDLALTLGLDPADPAPVHAAVLDLAGRLGAGIDGRPRVRFDPATGDYTVSDDVASDWRRAQALVRLAARSVSPAEEAAGLEAALALVEGRPGAEARPHQFAWLLHDAEVYRHIETTLVDAAHRLGELSLVQGRPRMAAWAAERGLMVVPGQEALHRLQMKAAALLDDSLGVEQAYRAAARTAGDLASGQGVQPETEDLYHKLTAP